MGWIRSIFLFIRSLRYGTLSVLRGRGRQPSNLPSSFPALFYFASLHLKISLVPPLAPEAFSSPYSSPGHNTSVASFALAAFLFLSFFFFFFFWEIRTADSRAKRTKRHLPNLGKISKGNYFRTSLVAWCLQSTNKISVEMFANDCACTCTRYLLVITDALNLFRSANRNISSRRVKSRLIKKLFDGLVTTAKNGRTGKIAARAIDRNLPYEIFLTNLSFRWRFITFNQRELIKFPRRITAPITTKFPDKKYRGQFLTGRDCWSIFAFNEDFSLACRVL